MLGSLWKNRRWPIGLDIGTDSVKMLQMHRSGSSVSVVACGQYHLPKGVEASSPDYRGHVAAGIRELLRQSDFRGRRVVSALPSSQLSIKNVRVAPMREEEKASALRNEAAERFNFPVDHDRLRWIEAGSVRQGAEVRDEVILLAAPVEVIENHLAILDDSGLVPEHIEAEPVSLFRVYQHFLRRRADEDAVTVSADIGRSATRVTVARGRKIVFIKRIDIGGSRLTDAVAKQLNLSHEEAYDLRVRLMRESDAAAGRRRKDDKADESAADRTSVDWTLQDAMRGAVEELAREVALCLRYCSVTFRGLRPERVILTGGEAYDPALVELLSKSLGVPCEVGRPLRDIDVERMNVAPNRRAALAEWAVCAGLALRETDFVTEPRENDDHERRLSA